MGIGKQLVGLGLSQDHQHSGDGQPHIARAGHGDAIRPVRADMGGEGGDDVLQLRYIQFKGLR